MLHSPIMKNSMFLQTAMAIIMSTALNAFAQEKMEAAPPISSGTPTVAEQPLKGTVKATIETSKGTIELELDADKAPISVANFVNYVKKSFYDGTIFHRVIPPPTPGAPHMIQGGGFTADMQPKRPTDKAIECESKNGLKNVRGSIAMARTNDPHSATTQFFINVGDNAYLNFPSSDGWGYAVFGKVTKGMDVVDAIVAVPTTSLATHRDVPKDTITLTKVTLTP